MCAGAPASNPNLMLCNAIGTHNAPYLLVSYLRAAVGCHFKNHMTPPPSLPSSRQAVCPLCKYDSAEYRVVRYFGESQKCLRANASHSRRRAPPRVPILYMYALSLTAFTG